MSDHKKSDNREEESPAFKVTDRRKFDASGNPRQPDSDEGEETATGPAKIGSRPQGGASQPPRPDPQADPFAGAGMGGPAEGDAGGAIPFPGGAAQGGAAAEAGPGPEGQPEQEVDFSAFIMSMATGVLMALGEVPDPMTGRQGPVHLESARHTVDIISMLREKTEGNLDAEEDRIIRQVLYELRMKYMEVVKNLGE